MSTIIRSFASVLITVVLLSIPSSASAGFVSSATVGVALPSIEVLGVETEGDAGYLFGGSLGWRFGDMVQWDSIESYYMRGDQSNNLGQFLYTASNYTIGTGIRIGWFGTDSSFHPYGSFGIAGSKTTLQYAWQWGFEWNAGVGMLFSLGDSSALGVRYRYRSTSIPGPSYLSPFDLNVNIHTIGVEWAYGN